jgi:hypothetical protein
MPPRISARTLVLARTLQDFHAWCRAQGRSPRDRTLLYASGPHVLRGLTAATVVRYGDWWNRPDGHALKTAVDRLEGSTAETALPSHTGAILSSMSAP